MQNEWPGVTFREKMAGGFRLGESDPQSGGRAGEDAGNIFTMHATIAIPDLSRFLAEPEHTGCIAGHIDFPPLGFRLGSTTGIFNLFSPSSDATMKHMVYELGFAARGKSYYMAGRKNVKPAAVTDLWKANTTLYTQLHEGTSKSGPIVGAGVLTIGIADFMAMIGTMRATNANSVEEAAAALVRFGRFFLGELWDTYGKHLVL